MTRIKICGITSAEDALAAVEYGAHALGFIFVPESPRYLDPARAREIGRAVPPFVAKVGVYRDWADRLDEGHPKDFDAFQFYANERGLRPSPGYTAYSRDRAIRAYRVRGEASLAEIAATCDDADALLLDAYHPDQLGGSGETFDWAVAREAAARFGKPVILAGGLTADNVGDAIAAVRPYAVDVSSGVEAEPGRKDYRKLRAFFDAVRRADARLDPE